MPLRKPTRAFRTDPLAQADVVVAVSEFAADLLVRHHGVAADRIGVIPHRLDEAWFEPVTPDRIAMLRHAWRIQPSERIVLAPAHAGPASGCLTLVDAARILVNGGLRDVVFVIADEGAGNDQVPDALDARILAQGLGTIFRRPAHCPDMPAAYAAADMIALPIERPAAFEENAAEAMAAGRPVIAPGIGALPEIVLAPPREPPEGRTGWLFRPREALDLARALADALAADSDTWHAIGGRARKLAERKFSSARVTDATLAVYAALLENAGASAQRR